MDNQIEADQTVQIAAGKASEYYGAVRANAPIRCTALEGGPEGSSFLALGFELLAA